MRKYVSRLLRAQGEGVDLSHIPELEQARSAKRLIEMGLLVQALRIPLTIIALIVLSSVPCLAQTAGPIFNGNSSNFGNMVREGMKLLAILLFVAGGVAVAFMIVNIMRKQEWNHWLIGALLAFGFGTVIAVIYSISQGQAVSVGTDF